MSADLDEPVHVEEQDPALADLCRCHRESAERRAAWSPDGGAQERSAHGWTPVGEAGVQGREYLRRRAGQHANVHVVEHASALWRTIWPCGSASGGTRTLVSGTRRRRDEAVQEAPTLLACSGRKAAVVGKLLQQAIQASPPQAAAIVNGGSRHRPPPVMRRGVGVLALLVAIGWLFLAVSRITSGRALRSLVCLALASAFTGWVVITARETGH